jgi:hypothetical protein
MDWGRNVASQWRVTEKRRIIDIPQLGGFITALNDLVPDFVVRPEIIGSSSVLVQAGAPEAGSLLVSAR